MISPERAEQIKRISFDTVRGQVFTSLYIPREHFAVILPEVFLSLGQLSELENKRLKKSKPLMFFEYYSKTTGEFAAGFPVFPSFRVMDEEEFEFFRKCLTEYREEFAKIIGMHPTEELEF